MGSADFILKGVIMIKALTCKSLFFLKELLVLQRGKKPLSRQKGPCFMFVIRSFSSLEVRARLSWSELFHGDQWMPLSALPERRHMHRLDQYLQMLLSAGNTRSAITSFTHLLSVLISVILNEESAGLDVRSSDRFIHACKRICLIW